MKLFAHFGKFSAMCIGMYIVCVVGRKHLGISLSAILKFYKQFGRFGDS